MKQTLEIPVRIRADRGLHRLEIEWHNGIVHHLDMFDLRRLCPCAVCEEVRARQQGQSELHMIAQDEAPSADLSAIIPVGNYAIQLTWADGHDTGIYTYDLLKQMGSSA